MLTAFLIYLVGVGALGWIAHRFLTEGQFVKDYFLGNRRLGPWVLALSFAATAISGGTFMGFPALIYTNGWVMALWIAGYMFVPLCTMAVLGKRINQASRLSGSITIPDVLRDRFESPSIAVLTSLILILFLGVNLVAQFKAGGLLMLEAWREVIESSSTFQGQVVLGSQSVPRDYLFGVSLFVIMVVAYTTYGGFWGVTLTDVLEGLIMLFGAVTLAVLALVKVGGLGEATAALLREDPALVYGPGPPVLGAEGAILRPGFLPPHLAVSFFIQWTIIGIAQPGQLVRLMSFREMKSLQRALCLCAVYYALIYASLLVVFICARALYPPAALGVTKTDDIMPFMIRQLASPISTVLAGILLAAPYAAIMSTVAAYLLIVSSSLVRDIYQRMLRPNASAKTLRRLSYAVTLAVGLVAFAGAVDQGVSSASGGAHHGIPPRFLQQIIVFSTEGLGVCLLAPVFLGLYWRGTTRAGALAGMLGGLACHLSLYWAGFIPLLVSLTVSFLLTILVSRWSAPGSLAVLDRYFPRGPSAT
ncbi:MAG TPA: sodium/solute symporter [Planctomycetota bacterium]|nr:sodium/solute symporter [Planctomycetota bacterium]